MTTRQPNPSRGGRPVAAAPSFEDIVTRGVSRGHLARLFGVAGSKIDSWRRRGCPSTGGRFFVRDVVAWLEQQAPTRDAPATEDSEQSLARWRRARAAREELQLAADRGDLVSREESLDLFVSAITALRARLRDATKKLAVRLFQSPSVVANERELRAEFDSLLRSLAGSAPSTTPSAEPDVPADDSGQTEESKPPADAGNTDEGQQP